MSVLQSLFQNTPVECWELHSLPETPVNRRLFSCKTKEEPSRIIHITQITFNEETKKVTKKVIKKSTDIEDIEHFFKIYEPIYP
jgi:hypothetical protein